MFTRPSDNDPYHENICKAIQELKTHLSVEGKAATILERTWEDWSLKESSVSDTKVRIMQWNILAQGFCPISNFYYCSRDTLAYPRRLYLILWEILRHQADVICLEEADLFTQIISFLEKHNLPFQGVFQEKPRSACLLYKDNFGPDGCAVIYRSDRFHCFSTKVVHLCNQPGVSLEGLGGTQLALFVHLHFIESQGEHKYQNSSPTSLLIVCTHLKASTEFHHLRSHQGSVILDALEKYCNEIPQCAVFVCGDFNADPYEPVIQKFMDSSLNLQSMYRQLHRKESGIDEEPPFTTWKTRFVGSRGSQRPSEAEVEASGGRLLHEACHTIDYMWYGKSEIVKPSAVLCLPSKDVIGANGLPNDHFPSDHLSLVAEFLIIPT